MPESTPILPYAITDTRNGVVTESTPDGGIIITVLPTQFRLLDELAELVSGTPIYDPIDRLRNWIKPVPRAVITLTRETLTVTVPGDGGPFTRTYPFDAVGEIRPNRYSNGIYFSITGLDNFDLLTQHDPAVVNSIGQMINETLLRMRSAPEANK